MYKVQNNQKNPSYSINGKYHVSTITQDNDHNHHTPFPHSHCLALALGYSRFEPRILSNVPASEGFVLVSLIRKMSARETGSV